MLDPYAKVILNGRRVWGEMGKVGRHNAYWTSWLPAVVLLAVMGLCHPGSSLPEAAFWPVACLLEAVLLPSSPSQPPRCCGPALC